MRLLPTLRDTRRSCLVPSSIHWTPCGVVLLTPPRLRTPHWHACWCGCSPHADLALTCHSGTKAPSPNLSHWGLRSCVHLTALGLICLEKKVQEGKQSCFLIHRSCIPFRFPGGSMVKNLPASVGNSGLIPGSGRFPGEGNGNPRRIPAWEIPWAESLAGYNPWSRKRIWHDLGRKQQLAFQQEHKYSFVIGKLLLTPDILNEFWSVITCLVLLFI